MKTPNKVKHLEVKTLHGHAPMRPDLLDIDVPVLRRVKKDYAKAILITLTALFLYFAFTGQLSGEMYVN